MPRKKIDKRSLKTKKAIYGALADLLTVKELRNITVQEISDKIDIHRSTFYKHFKDIYDVYEQLEQVIFNELDELISEYGEKNAFEFYPIIFKYIEENPKIFKMVFSPNNTGLLYQKLSEFIESLCRQIWKKNYKANIHDNMFDYIIRYHTNGCMAIIAKWILNDDAQSKEYIIKTISILDISMEKVIT